MGSQRGRTTSITPPEMLVLARNPALLLDDRVNLRLERQLGRVFKIGAHCVCHTVVR